MTVVVVVVEVVELTIGLFRVEKESIRVMRCHHKIEVCLRHNKMCGCRCHTHTHTQRREEKRRDAYIYTHVVVVVVVKEILVVLVVLVVDRKGLVD